MLTRLLVLVLAGLLCLGHTARAASTDEGGGPLVGEVATTGTPHVLDGRVNSLALIDTTMLLGGDFSRARSADARRKFRRANLLSFDSTDGRIHRRFRPHPNGVVNKVLDAGDGRTVYVAGDFTRIGGVRRQNLARVRIRDGSVVRAFDAGKVAGQVRDLQLVGGRLWVAGAFTHIAGTAQRALAALDPDTGGRDRFMKLHVAGRHHGGHTQVLKIDVSVRSGRLVMVGNFRKVAGAPRRQVAVLDLTRRQATVARWRTRFYAARCSAVNNTYLRDVDVSPDGTFFVASTTGGARGPKRACDTTARFEIGTDANRVRPSWVAHTGGDTTYAVEVTAGAIYVGGHFRWQNNPFGRDRPGPGAVPRQGIAALDPRNGLPLDWNPGRTLGVGVFDFLDAVDGLWVASDTDRINWQLRSRVARMRPGTTVLPGEPSPALPAVLWSSTESPGTWSRRDWAGPSPDAASGDVTGAPEGVRAAFMINGVLFLVGSRPVLVRRSFDGFAFGPAARVTPSGQGRPPAGWRHDLQRLTGMFHDNGRIYYTLRGRSSLYYRYFTASSGTVGARRLVANAGGVDLRGATSLLLVDRRVHWRAADGSSWSVEWRRTAQAARLAAQTRRRDPCGCTAGEGRVRFLFQGSPI